MNKPDDGMGVVQPGGDLFYVLPVSFHFCRQRLSFRQYHFSKVRRLCLGNRMAVDWHLMLSMSCRFCVKA